MSAEPEQAMRAARILSAHVILFPSCLLISLLLILTLCAGCKQASRRVDTWEGSEGRISGEKLRLKAAKGKYLNSLAALGLCADDLDCDRLIKHLGTPTEVFRQGERFIRSFVATDDSGRIVSRLDTVSNSRLYRLALTAEEPGAVQQRKGFTWGNFPLLTSEEIITRRFGQPNLPEPMAEHALVYSFFVDRPEARIFLVAEYLFASGSRCPYSVTVSIYYQAE